MSFYAKTPKNSILILILIDSPFKEPLFLGKNHYTCWAPILTIKNDPNRYSKRFLGVFGPFSRWANDFRGFWPKIRVFWVFEWGSQESIHKKRCQRAPSLVASDGEEFWACFVHSLRSLVTFARFARSLHSFTPLAHYARSKFFIIWCSNRVLDYDFHF